MSLVRFGRSAVNTDHVESVVGNDDGCTVVFKGGRVLPLRSPEARADCAAFVASLPSLSADEASVRNLPIPAGAGAFVREVRDERDEIAAREVWDSLTMSGITRRDPIPAETPAEFQERKPWPSI